MAASLLLYDPFPILATGWVKAGWGPFSQFKQLPLITPLIGGRGGEGVGKGTGWGFFWYRAVAFGLGLRAAGYLASPGGCSVSTSQRSFREGKKKMLEGKGSSVISPRQRCSPRGYCPQQPRACSSQRRTPRRCCYTHQAPCGYPEEAGTLLAVSRANTSTQQGPR